MDLQELSKSRAKTHQIRVLAQLPKDLLDRVAFEDIATIAVVVTEVVTKDMLDFMKMALKNSKRKPRS